MPVANTADDPVAVLQRRVSHLAVLLETIFELVVAEPEDRALIASKYRARLRAGIAVDD